MQTTRTGTIGRVLASMLAFSVLLRGNDASGMLPLPDASSWPLAVAGLLLVGFLKTAIRCKNAGGKSK